MTQSNRSALECVECQNCEWKGREDQTYAIRHYSQRVDPGEAEPAGECPECGALAHFVEAVKAGA